MRPHAVLDNIISLSPEPGRYIWGLVQGERRREKRGKREKEDNRRQSNLSLSIKRNRNRCAEASERGDECYEALQLQIDNLHRQVRQLQEVKGGGVKRHRWRYG